VQLYTYVRRVQHQEVCWKAYSSYPEPPPMLATRTWSKPSSSKRSKTPQRLKDHVSVERWKLRELEAHPLQASMPVLLVRQVGFLHVQLTPTRLLSPDGRPFFPARRCRHRDQQPPVDAQLPLVEPKQRTQKNQTSRYAEERYLLMCSW
jgi:hypothetical protein